MGEYVALSKVRAWHVHGACICMRMCMCGMCMACAQYVHAYVALSKVENPHPNPITLALTLPVTLSKVENALKSSKYTALPMVYATSTMSYAIALICPNVPNLKALAATLGLDADDVGAMCANKDVLAAVLKDVKP